MITMEKAKIDGKSIWVPKNIFIPTRRKRQHFKGIQLTDFPKFKR